MREPLARREVTLLDLVDSILQRGTALSADLILSVADVDLVQLDLRALLASVDTLERVRSPLAPAPSPAVDQTSGDHPAAPAPPSRAPLPTPRRPASHRGRLPAALAAHRRAAARIEADPHNAERGLAQLVLTLIELLRQLMERQALHRMESGTLDESEVERLGTTFMRLDERMEELTRAFGLEREDLNLRLGPLGDLL